MSCLRLMMFSALEEMYIYFVNACALSYRRAWARMRSQRRLAYKCASGWGSGAKQSRWVRYSTFFEIQERGTEGLQKVLYVTIMYLLITLGGTQARPSMYEYYISWPT